MGRRNWSMWNNIWTIGVDHEQGPALNNREKKNINNIEYYYCDAPCHMVNLNYLLGTYNFGTNRVNEGKYKWK